MPHWKGNFPPCSIAIAMDFNCIWFKFQLQWISIWFQLQLQLAQIWLLPFKENLFAKIWWEFMCEGGHLHVKGFDARPKKVELMEGLVLTKAGCCGSLLRLHSCVSYLQEEQVYSLLSDRDTIQYHPFQTFLGIHLLLLYFYTFLFGILSQPTAWVLLDFKAI